MTEQPPADLTALPDLLHGRGRSGPVAIPDPAEAERLGGLAQQAVDQRWTSTRRW